MPHLRSVIWKGQREGTLAFSERSKIIISTVVFRQCNGVHVQFGLRADGSKGASEGGMQVTFKPCSSYVYMLVAFERASCLLWPDVPLCAWAAVLHG